MLTFTALILWPLSVNCNLQLQM